MARRWIAFLFLVLALGAGANSWAKTKSPAFFRVDRNWESVLVKVGKRWQRFTIDWKHVQDLGHGKRTIAIQKPIDPKSVRFNRRAGDKHLIEGELFFDAKQDRFTAVSTVTSPR